MALLRPALTRLSSRPARCWGSTPGRSAHAARLVITRQRPGTATSVVFLTIEDETGPLSVIVWDSLPLPNRRHCVSGVISDPGDIQVQPSCVWEV
ncbi:MAG: hypothetical protein ACREXK_13515 [Gammaproteobacteria bacterium]